MKRRPGLRELVANADVEIVTDVEERDQYERLLAYVYQDGILVNEEIARRGWVLARAYEPNTVLQNSIDAAAQDAQQNQHGMWSPATCVASGPSVAITEIEANPPGPDEDNLDGERVAVINADQTEIDLTGRTLRDAQTAWCGATPVIPRCSSIPKDIWPPQSTIEYGRRVSGRVR